MSSSGFGSAERIEQFLAKYPDGPLTVAVGFASVKGIAWLARHTTNRPVTLLIGNCRKNHFAKWSHDDRASAVAFLNRQDVEVKNWYKKRPTPSEAHLKVWVAHQATAPGVLLGSANLTGAGLFRNREAVAEAAEPDRSRIARDVNDLVAKGWDAKKRVLDHLSEYPQPVASKQPTPKVRRRGCLAAVVSAATVVAVLVAALNIW